MFLNDPCSYWPRLPGLLLKIETMNKEHKFDRAYYTRESRKWQAVLTELRTENIQLKEQLSQAISQEVSAAFVEEAEQFQQRFLERDQVIDLLRHDINTLQQKISGHTTTGGEDRQFTLMEKDMEKLICEFHQMKVSFSRFLAANKPG